MSRNRGAGVKAGHTILRLLMIAKCIGPLFAELGYCLVGGCDLIKSIVVNCVLHKAICSHCQAKLNKAIKGIMNSEADICWSLIEPLYVQHERLADLHNFWYALLTIYPQEEVKNCCFFQFLELELVYHVEQNFSVACSCFVIDES